MIKHQRVLAIVPARGGSKGIPGKNLKKVGQHSLVGWAGLICQQLEWLDAAVLSTDDEQIAKEGVAYGLDLPFMRPSELASDEATALSVWQYTWLQAEAYYETTFDIAVWLQPTSPLRRPIDVARTMEALLSGDHLAATTVSEVPGHFNPYKILNIDNEKYVNRYIESDQSYSNRQAAPKYYYRNGYCYVAKRQCILDLQSIIDQRCIAVTIDRPTVNIDTEFELKTARWMLNNEQEAFESEAATQSY